MSSSPSNALAGRPWNGPPAEPSEMEAAQRVQARFLPQNPPRLETLKFSGAGLPGRAVGGDFYDFLEREPGRMALVLGDVSGHGLPAALMMAALQACLRSHNALSRVSLERQLESINGLFFECTADEHYATLFVGEYDDRTGHLRYANCGHVPPFLVRADGDVERLQPTATVLGMFERWNGASGEITLGPGDTLVAMTDGIVEAADPADAEFGDLRLLSTIVRYRHLSPAALIRAIARSLRMVCLRRPVDDATVVVARAFARDERGKTDG